MLTKSVGCSAAGYEQLKTYSLSPRYIAGAFGEERLREERGRRAVVVISIVDPVRVELELVVVEVEVGSVREIAISVRRIVPILLWHWVSRFTSRRGRTISSSPCILFGGIPP